MIPQNIAGRVQQWLSEDYDDATRKQVQHLVDTNPDELLDAFCQDLAFGTGGMRGLMGVGPNRLNTYTVRRATQGLAEYLRSRYPDMAQIKVAVAYDCRNNSPEFAAAAADTLAANGVLVYLYDSLRTTPQLSYTVRAMNCQAGIVITASHNPKEFNGYKVYAADGGQVVAPEDRYIMEKVASVQSLSEIRTDGDKSLIVPIGCEMDEAYINTVVASSLRPEAIRGKKDMPIVYTPIHGAGGQSVPRALARAGFSGVRIVSAQKDPNGDFPTVVSPNPEDSAAMDMALRLAQKVEAAVVLGTDPDTDRVGVYARTKTGEYFRPDGNELAILLTQYILSTLREKAPMPPSAFIARTIVTTPMLDRIAQAHGVDCKTVLTGFKYINALIDRNDWPRAESPSRFIMGAEESHGYLFGQAVRDKDAVQACLLIVEMVAFYAAEGRDLREVLYDAYSEYGLFVQGQQSITLGGVAGREEIQARMERLRANPPQEILGERVEYIYDYSLSKVYNAAIQQWESIEFDRSNVIQIQTVAGTILTVRPSGTEPKIKYYYSLRGEYTAPTCIDQLRTRGDEMLQSIQR